MDELIIIQSVLNNKKILIILDICLFNFVTSNFLMHTRVMKFYLHISEILRKISELDKLNSKF